MRIHRGGGDVQVDLVTKKKRNIDVGKMSERGVVYPLPTEIRDCICLQSKRRFMC